MKRAFDFLEVPRIPEKPRKTAVLIGNDRGIVYALQKGYLEDLHGLIDVVKFDDHHGLAALWTEDYFKRKISLYRQYGIPCFPGGVSFEIAFLQHQTTRFFQRVKEIGFSGVEISEDVIPMMPRRERLALIKEASAIGLDVYTEVGRKFPERPLDAQEAIESIKADLEAGSKMVTVEGAENWAIMRGEGSPDTLRRIVEAVGMENLVFESGPGPFPETTVFLIRTLGPEVNLENISMWEASNVLAMRRMMHRAMEWECLTK